MFIQLLAAYLINVICAFTSVSLNIMVSHLGMTYSDVISDLSFKTVHWPSPPEASLTRPPLHGPGNEPSSVLQLLAALNWHGHAKPFISMSAPTSPTKTAVSLKVGLWFICPLTLAPSMLSGSQ